MLRLRIAYSILLIALGFPLTAHAQLPPGPVVKATYSWYPDSYWSTAGTVLYPLEKRFSLGMEVIYVRGIQNWGDSARLLFSELTSYKREALIIAPVFGIDFGTWKRLELHLVGGGGVTGDSVSYQGRDTFTRRLPDGTLETITVDRPRVSSTDTWATLIGGGGVGIKLTPRLSLDGNARAVYMHGRSAHWLRIGAGGTYRF